MRMKRRRRGIVGGAEGGQAQRCGQPQLRIGQQREVDALGEGESPLLVRALGAHASKGQIPFLDFSGTCRGRADSPRCTRPRPESATTRRARSPMTVIGYPKRMVVRRRVNDVEQTSGGGGQLDLGGRPPRSAPAGGPACRARRARSASPSPSSQRSPQSCMRHEHGDQRRPGRGQPVLVAGGGLLVGAALQQAVFFAAGEAAR